MWVMLSDAFLSIVADRSNVRRLLVRARIKGDIELAFPQAKVRCTPKGDYLYRASVLRTLVMSTIRAEVRAINYDNFKDSVKDDTRHNTYLRVWSIMKAYQEDEANK